MIDFILNIPIAISIYLLFGVSIVMLTEKIVYKSPIGTHLSGADIFIILVVWPYILLLYIGTLAISLIKGFRNLR